MAVGRVRNFYVFFKKFLLGVGKSNKPVRKQEGEEKIPGCIKTAEPSTQYDKNYIPKYSSGNLTQLQWESLYEQIKKEVLAIPLKQFG